MAMAKSTSNQNSLLLDVLLISAVVLCGVAIGVAVLSFVLKPKKPTSKDDQTEVYPTRRSETPYVEHQLQHELETANDEIVTLRQELKRKTDDWGGDFGGWGEQIDDKDSFSDGSRRSPHGDIVVNVSRSVHGNVANVNGSIHGKVHGDIVGR
jgi:hypothetical protein